MAALKLERNQAIAAAVEAGEPLKVIANRYGLSVARVSKIAQDTPITDMVGSAVDLRATLLAMRTLLNSLLNRDLNTIESSTL